jgi:hypothetical protein
VLHCLNNSQQFEKYPFVRVGKGKYKICGGTSAGYFSHFIVETWSLDPG